MTEHILNQAPDELRDLINYLMNEKKYEFYKAKRLMLTLLFNMEVAEAAEKIKSEGGINAG